MIPRPLRPMLGVLMAVAATGCQGGPPRTRADAATAQACRVRVDQVYAQQNRADLSIRDQRDTPFADSYNSGVTTRGLSARYGRDTSVANCIGGSTPATDQGTGPVFSPVARQ